MYKFINLIIVNFCIYNMFSGQYYDLHSMNVIRSAHASSTRELVKLLRRISSSETSPSFKALSFISILPSIFAREGEGI